MHVKGQTQTNIYFLVTQGYSILLPLSLLVSSLLDASEYIN